jgi:hypothetical protein
VPFSRSQSLPLLHSRRLQQQRQRVLRLLYNNSNKLLLPLQQQ